MSSFQKARKGDIALVGFDRAIVSADYKSSRKTYYQFCIVTRCNRQGRVITVQRKGDNFHAPVTLDCLIVPVESLSLPNPVHYLGTEEFASVDAAKTALLALYASHGRAA